jgi:hypothetical protein
VNNCYGLQDKTVRLFSSDTALIGHLYFDMLEQFVCFQVANLQLIVVCRQDAHSHTGVCFFKNPSMTPSWIIVLGMTNFLGTTFTGCHSFGFICINDHIYATCKPGHDHEGLTWKLCVYNQFCEETAAKAGGGNISLMTLRNTIVY